MVEWEDIVELFETYTSAVDYRSDKFMREKNTENLRQIQDSVKIVRRKLEELKRTVEANKRDIPNYRIMIDKLDGYIKILNETYGDLGKTISRLEGKIPAGAPPTAPTEKPLEREVQEIDKQLQETIKKAEELKISGDEMEVAKRSLEKETPTEEKKKALEALKSKVKETEKEKKEEEKEEVPKEIPSSIADLHPEFRRCIDGIHKYMEDLHDKTGKWKKDAAMRNLHRASQAYLNVYKNVKPIALNKESFYEFIIALSSGRRMILANWFNWLPKSLDDILNAKTTLENEKDKIEDKNLSKVADDILDKFLGSETLKLFSNLREVYHNMIKEAQNLKIRK